MSHKTRYPWYLIGLSLLLFLLSTSNLSGVASYTDYTNNYNLSGSIKLPDTPRVSISGDIEITAEDMGDMILYTHDYSASAIGIGSESDVFEIIEYKENKTLDLSSNTNTTISIIWELFSDFDTNPIAAFYHITEDEKSTGEVSILNYTVPIQGEAIYYSSEMEIDIQTNKIVIPLDLNNSITAYYDIDNNVLMGIELTFTDNRIRLQGSVPDYTIRFAITDSTLQLPVEREFPFLLVTGIGGGAIILSTAGYFIYRRLTAPSILEGGVD